MGIEERAVIDVDNKCYSKDGKVFRQFHETAETEKDIMIKRTYKNMHTKQTVDYVKQQHENWCKFDKFELTIMEALDLLASFQDESDPDFSEANSYHAYQTAESCRLQKPELDWYHLTGLIHDVGKVMGMHGQPQWSTVGDTFPVGLAPRETIAFGVASFSDNPDLQDQRYNTRHGMYAEGCGLDNVLLSWGHDEYMYRVLKNHESCALPEEALWCVRYHSFYPWHSSGDYRDLCNESDEETLKWINEFNTNDLYSKNETLPDVEALKPYYQSLVDKYIPGKVKF